MKNHFYYLITNTRKERRLSVEDVKFILEHCGYKAQMFDTQFKMGAKRWSKRREFTNALIDNGLTYFAYIKFYKGGDNSYAIVAGKTKVTECYRTDICFTKSEKFKGKAKAFLRDNNLEWDTEKIMVVIPNNTKSEQEAIDIEREITGLLGLYSS
ncbi:hypothetical protein [Ruminococcus flavefaciens]|uniref:hypothetical protein n=1 Tax=Ruminococcus flavefaciens TaxID=1265 RepID=UPI00068477D1|nr:hypothetical protein [Ruminococcus flavefaciens]